MKLPNYRLGDPVLPTELDAKLARVSSYELAEFLASKDEKYYLKLGKDEAGGKTIEVPAIALELLLEILVHTAQEKPVKIEHYTKNLADYQAADILGVSRHRVWDLMNSGEIPYQIVRDVRKMRYEDVIEYKQRIHAEAMKGLDEIVAESEAMGLYD